jgi:hypothetical protein
VACRHNIDCNLQHFLLSFEYYYQGLMGLSGKCMPIDEGQLQPLSRYSVEGFHPLMCDSPILLLKQCGNKEHAPH